ncbi:tyrosine-type recombinase/integrase [Corallibacter sp.]|uniref:tyrosine-type recombinase/integrase n=1 Tax=Corallibacter sp. TaxID=2038084 RepID=UPI003AB6607C
MASISVLRRKKALKNGQYPIIIKAIKDRKIKIISLGFTCSDNEWNEKRSEFKKNHENYIQRNALLNQYKSKASKIIDDFKSEGIDFTLNQFEERFRGDHKRNNASVFDFFDYKVDQLNEAGRTGSAKAYKDTGDAVFKFYPRKNLKFQEIDVSFLDSFEAHLRSRGNIDGGIAVRMRQLRALYNDAISKNLVDESFYPFKKYKISKLKGKGIKRALTRSEIQKIYEFDINKHPHLLHSRNYFVFSYFTRGMNFVDMMNLTWDNIHNDTITYIRSKTKGRFSIKILEPVAEILSYYSTLNPNTNYVFPILLKENLTPTQIQYRKAKTLKRFNKDLKEIAKLVGIDKKLTSYVARHSFATNLKQLGVSTDIISESMGHQNINITNTYLKEFDSDVINEANEKLIF